MKRDAIGRRFGPYTGCVRADRLRRFAEVTGETAPEYFDTAAAQAAGWRDIPAPPTYLFCLQMLDTSDPMDWVRQLGFPNDRLLHAEQTFTYHRPICAGDVLICEIEVEDIYERKGGALVFITARLLGFSTEGDLLAEARGTLAYRQP